MVRTKIHVLLIVGLLIAIVAFGTFFISHSEAFQTSPDTTYLCAPENAFSRNKLSGIANTGTIPTQSMSSVPTQSMSSVPTQSMSSVPTQVIIPSQVTGPAPVQVMSPAIPVSTGGSSQPQMLTSLGSSGVFQGLPSRPVSNTSAVLALLAILRQMKNFMDKYPSFSPKSGPKPSNESIDSYITKLENALENGWSAEDVNLEGQLGTINSIYLGILNEYQGYQTQLETAPTATPSFKQPTSQSGPILTGSNVVVAQPGQTSIKLNTAQQTQVLKLRQQIQVMDTTLRNPSISRDQFRSLLGQRIELNNQLRELQQPIISAPIEAMTRLRSGN